MVKGIQRTAYTKPIYGHPRTIWNTYRFTHNFAASFQLLVSTSAFSNVLTKKAYLNAYPRMGHDRGAGPGQNKKKRLGRGALETGVRKGSTVTPAGTDFASSPVQPSGVVRLSLGSRGVREPSVLILSEPHCNGYKVITGIGAGRNPEFTGAVLRALRRTAGSPRCESRGQQLGVDRGPNGSMPRLAELLLIVFSHWLWLHRYRVTGQ